MNKTQLTSTPFTTEWTPSNGPAELSCPRSNKIFNLPSGKVKDYLLVHYVHGKIVVWIDYSYMLEVIVKLNYSLRSWEND